MKRPIPTLALALAALLISAAAHAGPTVSTDLDLGTSTRGTPSIAAAAPSPSPLYTVGFATRAGWRYDVAPVWFLPESGGGYATERYAQSSLTTAAPVDGSLGRLFVGGRVGWSGALQPELHFEPSVFGHAGGGFYGGGANGPAFDVGLSLDLRIRRHFIIGAQVAYDVVTVYSHDAAGPCGTTIVTPTGPITLPCGGGAALPPVADPWVSYGVHAGWLFW